MVFIFLQVITFVNAILIMIQMKCLLVILRGISMFQTSGLNEPLIPKNIDTVVTNKSTSSSSNPNVNLAPGGNARAAQSTNPLKANDSQEKNNTLTKKTLEEILKESSEQWNHSARIGNRSLLWGGAATFFASVSAGFYYLRQATTSNLYEKYDSEYNNCNGRVNNIYDHNLTDVNISQHEMQRELQLNQCAEVRFQNKHDNHAYSTEHELASIAWLASGVISAFCSYRCYKSSGKASLAEPNAADQLRVNVAAVKEILKTKGYSINAFNEAINKEPTNEQNDFFKKMLVVAGISSSSDNIKLLQGELERFANEESAIEDAQKVEAFAKKLTSKSSELVGVVKQQIVANKKQEGFESEMLVGAKSRSKSAGDVDVELRYMREKEVNAASKQLEEKAEEVYGLVRQATSPSNFSAYVNSDSDPDSDQNVSKETKRFQSVKFGNVEI